MANAIAGAATSNALAFSSDGSEDALQPPLQNEQTQNQQCLERPAVPTVQGGESTSGAAAYQYFARFKVVWIMSMGALVGVAAYFS
jgi:hypothetical protein